MRKVYSEEVVRLRTGREVPDVLRELYLEKRYSDQEIAEALGLTRALVNQWRQKYDINRDDRPPVELAS